MTEPGNVPVVSWSNANKTEGNYQTPVDYFIKAKEREAEALQKTSIFTYAGACRS